MTFLQILQDSYRRLNYATTPAAEVTTRLKAFINETHEELLSDPTLTSLLYGTVTFDSVASRARYGIATNARVRSMTDSSNQYTLRPVGLDWYRMYNPNPANWTGTPDHYVPLGTVAVQQVPAATGTGLWIASTSAGDTAGPTVTIDAIRVGGYPHSPAAQALTGAVRAQIGALTDYLDVTQFQLSAACLGDVSLFDAAAVGNTLAVIPRGLTSSRYWGFALTPTPVAALTYTLDIEHELQALSGDLDEPLLPPRFHRLLAIGARMKEYEKTSDDRYELARAEYERGRSQLRYAVGCPPGYLPVARNGQLTGHSRLGPYYPADVYQRGTY